MATRTMRIKTADDVLDVPVPSHLHGYEFVDGKLVEVSMPGQRHAQIAVEIIVRLHNHVRQHGDIGRVYSEAGYALGLDRDPQRLREPDVSFVSLTNLERFGALPAKRGFIHGTPDLAVEIDSASRPKHKHMQQRIQDFLDAGVRLLWIIHSEANSATVYHPDGSARLLRENDALDGEDVLPGLLIPLHQLFND